MGSDNDAIEKLIKEVAVKHGVALSKDDPILMLHTINRQLARDTQESQEIMLSAFQSQLEEVAHRWSEESKSKAERVLNASLQASKEAMAVGVQEASKLAANELGRVIKESEDSVTKVVGGVRNASIINLVASILVLIAALVVAIKN